MHPRMSYAFFFRLTLLISISPKYARAMPFFCTNSQVFLFILSNILLQVCSKYLHRMHPCVSYAFFLFNITQFNFTKIRASYAFFAQTLTVWLFLFILSIILLQVAVSHHLCKHAWAMLFFITKYQHSFVLYCKQTYDSHFKTNSAHLQITSLQGKVCWTDIQAHYFIIHWKSFLETSPVASGGTCSYS